MANISVVVADVAFVSLAATNVAVMLEAAQPSRSGTTKTRLIAVHRAGGYFSMKFGVTRATPARGRWTITC